jgi:hypothetical protein
VDGEKAGAEDGFSSTEEEAWGASDDRGGDSGRRERAETAAAAAGQAAGLFRQGRSKRLHDNGRGRAGPANPDRRLAPNGRDLPVT